MFAETNLTSTCRRASEIVGLPHGYSGLRFAMFHGRIRQHDHGLRLMVLLFLGWNLPCVQEWFGPLGAVLPAAVFFTKVACWCSAIWVRWTIPRFGDQLMDRTEAALSLAI
jgi:NADH:ubiquinone oxidoreductase subunit H